MAENGTTPGKFVARLIWVVIGVLVIGLGRGLLKAINVGVDPYTAANIGISNLIGWDLGSYQLLSNIVLFIPMLIWGRKYIGIGSIVNMVFAGYAIQFFAGILTPLVPDDPKPVVTMVLFVVGILVFALGASLYLTAALGTSPYDALAPMIVDHTGAKYRVVRTVQDVFFLLLAVVFQGAIGVGTIVTAFFTGPLIEFFTQKVSTPLMASVLPPATVDEPVSTAGPVEETEGGKAASA
ncbi:YczE/YyaS/YitT family protein [Microbacterium sp. bgisy203]|uniref:YczE/YyaS/YitT family protein n=1 Tax=Microbacterium sp. bgisy203 TaxID=3413799 RepID=UPI003D70E5ED